METRWLVGGTIALIGGGVAAWLFLAISKRLLGIPGKPESGAKRVPPWLTGAIERSFFFVLVTAGSQAVAPAMIGWLALKLATNWNHPSWNTKTEVRTHALLGLLAGLVSLGFAYVGALIACGELRVGL